MVISTVLGEMYCNFYNCPKTLFILVLITSKCFPEVNQTPRNIPRCF